MIAGVGGFLGTCARFLINRLFVMIWRAPFPLATFTINVVGCFIIGILVGIMGKYAEADPKINAFLVTGFCGGFTTFSTFSLESFRLSSEGEILISLLYMAASVVAGFIAVWLGLAVTR